MSINEQGSSAAPSNPGLQADIRSSFAQNSPLQLLNLPEQQQTPPILDPQKLVNDIAVKRETERIEAQYLNDPAAHPPAQEPPIVPDIQDAKDPDNTDALNQALDGQESETTEESPTPTPDKTDDTDDPLADVPDDPKAENFKRLREKTKSYHQRMKEAQEAHASDRKRLEEYETGAVMPELLKEKDERIAQLEPLEKLHNLKASPEFRRKYVEPLNHLGSRLEDLASQYDVTPEAMHHALGLRNTRELDQFLVSQFGNTVGAAQAKQMIENAQQLQRASQHALGEPVSALQQLQKESAALELAQEESRISNIKQAARDNWVAAVKHIREEGIAKELIPGDIEHNRRFVEPIQTAASREYGKLMVALTALGVKEVPDSVAQMMARMTLLAHTSATNQARAVAAEKYITELEKGAERSNYVSRPSLTGRNGTGNVSASSNGAAKPADPKTMAAQQLADLGFNRGR